ncbi:MAG: response regulator, partial [Acidobacteria bacterium]|nr:response regulator [Acidobacteriota bacterium]
TLYAGLLVGLAFVGVRYRTKSLRRRNTLLQARVDERTRELAEKVHQLEESEHRAYLYAQAKSQFLANMSHEIRTPINGVIGMTSLLLDTPLTREQRERADLVKRSGDMLLTIINDILDFSKIEAGKLSLEKIEFELPALLEDVLELVARKAQAKGLELSGFVSPEVPQMLLGDPIRLRQILINLVDNAIKFTEQGEVSVLVRLGEETTDAIVLRCEVRDTGIGIKTDALNHLFMPFAQADNSTTRKYGGTGLGLAIAKQLVELMSGEIRAESEVGAGSTFWFTARFDKSSSEPIAPRGHVAFRGRRALYAGARGTQCEHVLAQLKAWEVEAEAVHDAAGALAVLEHERRAFDFVMIDSRLPDMDGEQLAQTISSDATSDSLSLILLKPLAERRETAGRFQVLTKPVRRSQLYSRLCAALHLFEEEETVVSSGDADDFAIDARSSKPLKDFRLLLVEDNQTNRQVAVSTLAQLGYRTESVVNGREAIAALQEAEYDLVFMDCHMPEMDGFEATAEIRRQESSSRRTPIVAMTASALPEDRARCLNVGMDDYLTKPLHREELRAVLERWLHDTELSSQETFEESEAAPLEPEAMRELRHLGGANQSFLSELIDLFLQESVERLKRMRQAALNQDLNALQEVAHTQRGACLNFGAQQMAELCAALENGGGSNAKIALSELSEKVARVEREFFRVRLALEAE